jgi:2-methylaconitate cis-trans-isomerase PrpF
MPTQKVRKLLIATAMPIAAVAGAAAVSMSAAPAVTGASVRPVAPLSQTLNRVHVHHTTGDVRSIHLPTPHFHWVPPIP